MESCHSPVEMIGEDPSILELRKILQDLAKVDVNVLIEGETGTGKDVAARYLYHCNPTGTFVHVDCGALQESLLASELFGYERGAFTGATQNKRGLIEAANSGMLFMDEIGELDLHHQRQLLTTLDSKRVRPIGSVTQTSVRFRLVAATNRDLRSEVEHGRFREDLYYRLNVVKIRVPPLRERLGDIELLSTHFLRALNQGPLSPTCLSQLMAYDWPGNIRQLRACIQRMVVLCGDTLPDQRHFPPTIRLAVGVDSNTPPIRTTDPTTPYTGSHSSDGDKELLVRTVRSASGNLSRAAQAMGIARTTLYRRMTKHGLALARVPRCE
jgi:transcriptional regulator with PAS, ATPase and Fis domain